MSRRALVTPPVQVERPVSKSMVVPSGRGAPALDPALLRYRLLAPRAHTSPRELALAYASWRRVWARTFAELDGDGALFSDDFTRQDELGVLFHDEECVGMTAFRWLDTAGIGTSDDSYFRPWPQHALAALRRAGRRVCVGSYLTVEPAWRGPRGAVSTKELLLALAVERYLASPADVMAGTLRNDRGMNGLAYRLGARAVATGVEHHGVAVDLVLFERDAKERFQLTPLVEEVTQTLLSTALTELR
jgi:hypothetical protein